MTVQVDKFYRVLVLGVLAVTLAGISPRAAIAAEEDTFSKEEILAKTRRFFGATTKGRKVFWQGPSIGFDFGGNASTVFTLIYHLKRAEALFQRYPGVDGSFYFIAGIGVNYQQAGDVILAPIRTGVGLRAGASIGYLHYSRKHSWLPF